MRFYIKPWPALSWAGRQFGIGLTPAIGLSVPMSMQVKLEQTLGYYSPFNLSLDPQAMLKEKTAMDLAIPDYLYKSGVGAIATGSPPANPASA